MKPLLLIAITILAVGCGEKNESTADTKPVEEKVVEVKKEAKTEESVTETKPELEGVNLDKLEERESIWYLKDSETPYTGKVYSLHPNGQKSSKATFKDGKRDGPLTAWHENGQKSAELTFKDGELDGLLTEWHPNGQKFVELNYKNPKETEKYWNSKGEPVDSRVEAIGNTPTGPLADSIVGKVITLEIRGEEAQMMFNANGVMLGGQDGNLNDHGLTYRIYGYEVLIFDAGESGGGIWFPSSSPKVGDQVKAGYFLNKTLLGLRRSGEIEGLKQKFTIIKIETDRKVDFSSRSDESIENKIHTFSKGTKDLLSSLDTPVVMSFFASQDKNNMPPELISFAKHVDSLLKDYSSRAGEGLIEIERIDPAPDSEGESRAKINNLQEISGRSNEPAYLGLTVTCLDRKSTIPFFHPRREQMLEYDISKAIIEATREKSPKIGIMSALPVQGGSNSAIPQPDQDQQNQPWHFYTELKRDYDPDPSKSANNLIDLGMNIEEIPKDMDVVLLIHPAGITDQTQFALDQFLLRGGNIVAFLDPFSAVAAQSNTQRTQLVEAPQSPDIPTSSNMNKILSAWGIRFESNQVIADRAYESPQSQNSSNPVVLSITREATNENHTLMRLGRDFLMYFSGVFDVSEREGIKVETLIESSKKSQLVNPQSVQLSPDQVTQNFKASGKKYPLALRLSGRFVTAFPKGVTKEKEFLKNSKEGSSGSVILVADSDMLFDALSVGKDLNGKKTYRNYNIPFLQIAIEVASGRGILYDNQN